MNLQGKLRDSNCFEIASNSNSGDGLNFLISTQLDAGTYYIEVYNSSLSENGPYALNVEGDFTNDDHGNSCGSATSVNTRSILGDLSVYGDRDFFRIELTSSDQLRVTTASNMNTQGKLRDANCFEIASNSNSGSGLNFLIDRQLDPGIYYVEVYNSRVSDKGAYEFIVESPTQFSDSQTHKLYLPSLLKP